VNELHLFAGAGGGILGGQLLGHTTVCAVEIEKYPRQVLLQRQRDGILPKFPIWDDVCTFDGRPWRGSVDVLCGGFPCQDISSAGKGAGISGERSGLWKEYLRLISEIQPTYIFAENSPLLRIRGLEVILRDLAELGYNARWGVLGYRHIGGPTHRDRMWVCASTRKEYGRGIYRWTNKKIRNMGQHKPSRSLVNRYMEEMDSEREWRKQQRKTDCAPYLFRLDNGMAKELDELKAIGNGQVPQVAATAFRILS
jgi:DNA (cytosine-5)-methyltransferase 1